MENLNAENVKCGLYCIGREEDVLCADCVYRKYDGLECHRIVAREALALINSQERRIGKLAEEVEDLKVTLLARTMALTTLKAVKKDLTEENERLQKYNAVLIEDNHILSSECIPMAKADTVREMQERLRQSFDNTVDHASIYTESQVLFVIDQIAKEMLEGDNEN